MKTVLKRSAINRGGREGHVETTDERLHHELATPSEMTGKPTDDTNSFELVALAYSACLGSALQKAFEIKEIKYDDFSVEVENVVLANEKGKQFSFNIKVHIEGVEDALKQAMIDAANKICPFSKAIQGNVDVNIKIV
jgi:Ohr subfamily peroxiredoxin